MNGTQNKTKARPAAGDPAVARDALDELIFRLDRSAPITRLREDFSDAGLPMVLIRGDEAPVKLRGRRPQVFVDTKTRHALCVVVNDEDTKISDVLYVGAEALATAYDFPREPGNKVHEALVNSFALSYLTNRCGPEQAHLSYRVQLDKLQRARLQDAIDTQLRQEVALRCWAIGTALDTDVREALLSQVEKTDEDTAEVIVTLNRSWGLLSPSSGVEAEAMVASTPF